MTESQSDERCVESWLVARVDRRRTPPQIAQLLVVALAAVDSHARTTLGDPTLEMILRRVVDNACTKFAFLNNMRAALGLTPNPGTETPPTSHVATADELRAATHSILVELLGVLAMLTGGTLRKGLHDALSAADL